MKSTAATVSENGVTPPELQLLEALDQHMDEWIDHICKRTDEIFHKHGFIPGKAVQTPLSNGNDERRVA